MRLRRLRRLWWLRRLVLLHPCRGLARCWFLEVREVSLALHNPSVHAGRGVPQGAEGSNKVVGTGLSVVGYPRSVSRLVMER